MAVFTFQSTVHSDHVLQCLNDQRQRDILCDVTVAVGDRSFRAHCSVLASCSEYFHNRVISVTGQNATITLSDEVTVEGFEPLLEFAYTSKLPFTKENIHAIHRSAEFLGFHNLESACFDFLIPKFSEGRKTSQEVKPRTCCSGLDPHPNGDVSVESNQSKLFESCISVSSRGAEHTDFPSQYPQSEHDQIKSREEQLCLETCGPQMAPLSLEIPGSGVCPVLPLACPDSNKADHSTQFCERDILEIEDVCNRSELSLADCGLPCELSTSGDINPPELTESGSGDVPQTVESLVAQTNCNSGSCSLNTSDSGDCSNLLGQSEFGLEQRVKGELSNAALTALSHEEGFVERSSVEREVAEHLAKGFWSDSCPSETQPLSLESIEQNNLAKASDFHWLKQLDLSSSVGDCPFLKELESNDHPASRTESLSHSEKSPYMSSSFNSGDDSDLDTDGDTEATSKRAAEIQLPFPVGQISVLNRSAFQQLLKHSHLTPDQLEFVHDVRRRSKNRVAAQRCRKRKLDGINELECEIKKLTSEKERLLREKTGLEQNLEETRHSLCELCKSVSVESLSDKDNLQFLAKLSSPETPTPSSCPVGKNENSQISIEILKSSDCDPSKQPAGSIKTAAPHLGTESDSQQSCSHPISLLRDCLDMNNIL